MPQFTFKFLAPRSTCLNTPLSSILLHVRVLVVHCNYGQMAFASCINFIIIMIL